MAAGYLWLLLVVIQREICDMVKRPGLGFGMSCSADLEASLPQCHVCDLHLLPQKLSEKHRT